MHDNETDTFNYFTSHNQDMDFSKSDWSGPCCHKTND